MNIPNFFISGSDTGVGKTVITGLIADHLNKNGVNIVTQKWIQTGCDSFSEDIDSHIRAMGLNRKDFENYNIIDLRIDGKIIVE